MRNMSYALYVVKNMKDWQEKVMIHVVTLVQENFITLIILIQRIIRKSALYAKKHLMLKEEGITKTLCIVAEDARIYHVHQFGNTMENHIELLNGLT